MSDAQLSVELLAKIGNYTRNLREAGRATEQTGSQISSASNKITSAIAGAFSVSAVIGFGKEVLKATAEYQKFQAVLSNTLGSSALANLKLKELQDFAAKTPFGVNELTGAFVKLANSGFKPTGDEMTRLGDLASSTGKSFDQLAEAIIDAQTGEFERLKEFGVRAKDAGDSVIFTYKGVQTQVEKTSDSIRNYITSLGAAEGTSGAMAKISETLGGKISNLGDSWDQMLIVVGGNTEGVFNSAIDIIGDAIDSITEYNRELQLASKYKLSGGFGDAIKRFAQGIATGGKGVPTQLETLGLAASTASDKVSKFVAETIRGAKKTADFGKAIASLKSEADRNMKGIKVPGLAMAFKDIYEEGFKALQDARTNFDKELNKPNSNFGKSAKDKKVKIKAPELEIPDNPAKIFEDLFKKVSAANAGGALKIPAPKDGIEITGGLVPILLPKIDPGNLKEQIEALNIEAGLNKIVESAEKSIKELISLPNLVNVASITIGDAFQSMGEAIASGQSIIAAAGDAIRKTFAELLSALGQQFISMGAAKIAAGILATPFGGKLIAEGAGLVALGSGLKLGGGFVGASGKSGKGGATAFADGGIISGPTLAYMGEYAGAKADPEVVAPLSKLKNMLGQTDSSGNVTPNSNQTPVFVQQELSIDGKKLVALIRTVQDNNKRIG